MNLNNGFKNQKDSDQNTLESFKILISNIKYLKDKTWGCPWQKIQSHKSLIPFLNEESSELIDAIYEKNANNICCLLYTSPSPRDNTTSRMPSSA